MSKTIKLSKKQQDILNVVNSGPDEIWLLRNSFYQKTPFGNYIKLLAATVSKLAGHGLIEFVKQGELSEKAVITEKGKSILYP